MKNVNLYSFNVVENAIYEEVSLAAAFAAAWAWETLAGPVELSQLLPCGTTVWLPTEVPLKPKLLVLSDPSEFVMLERRPATCWSYPTCLEDLRPISFWNELKLDENCSITIVCVSTSQICSVMIFFAIS